MCILVFIPWKNPTGVHRALHISVSSHSLKEDTHHHADKRDSGSSEEFLLYRNNLKKRIDTLDKITKKGCSKE